MSTAAKPLPEDYPMELPTYTDMGRHGGRHYFQGLAAGILTGAIVAILLPRLFRDPPPSADTMMRSMPPERPSQKAGLRFVSRREDPESSGDPASVSGPASTSGLDFNLSGGAPGGKTEPEQLSMPGRPGPST
jgi:hypothetical protein